MSEKFAITIVLITLFGCVTMVLRALIENYRRNRSEKVQADLIAKMIDKFGSAPEMVAFLQSEGGTRLLQAAPVEGVSSPYSRILNSAQFGSVLTVFGAGLLTLRRGADADGREPLLVLGTLVLTLGLGLLVSGGISYLLSRSWGLLDGRPETGR